MTSRFIKLNDGWNADPNAPNERVDLHGHELSLSFNLNRFQFPAQKGERATLRFSDISHYRLGDENDHAWYAGVGRYSEAPGWGDFYEVREDFTQLDADGWIAVRDVRAPRHFLFYLRDRTFECLATDWMLER
ncbi:MAG: hypothetical protein K2Y04_06255 [Caulobacteraceae bacterium]|nr:hypothetical protein [Caulobacteraceae bacterium]